jgi:hypothetical protein
VRSSAAAGTRLTLNAAVGAKKASRHLLSLIYVVAPRSLRTPGSPTRSCAVGVCRRQLLKRFPVASTCRYLRAYMEELNVLEEFIPHSVALNAAVQVKPRNVRCNTTGLNTCLQRRC